MDERSPWLLLGAMAAALAASPLELRAQASKGVHVCLGADNVLRFTPGERCPQGQRMFRLAEVEDEVGVTKDRDDPPNAVVSDLKSKVDFLTRRVSNLEDELRKREDNPATSRVAAPFEVVDKSGNPIFIVTDEQYGSVKRKGRLHIGRATGGSNYSMLVHNAGGTVVVAVGEGQESAAGSMQFADAKGTVRARLSAMTGLMLMNSSGGGVASILSGSQGAGQFWLYDASGNAMVKAGTTTPGVGLIQAGPGVKCVPTGSLRVPDCILGRQMQ